MQEIATEMNAVDKSIHEIMSRLGASGPPPPSVLALYARREELTRELVALAERK